MKRFTLNVKSREEKGRGPSRRLRTSGRIPAVVYGTSGSHGLSIEQAEFRTMMRDLGDSAAIIELHEDGKDQMISVLQEIQRNPISGSYEHVDFHEVNRGVEMTGHVPVHVVNEKVSPGVKLEGGLLEQPVHSVDVRCLPKDLPEYITVDVAELHTGESLHIKDVTAPEGVRFTGDPEIVLVACVGHSEGSSGVSEEEAAEAAEAAEVAEGEAAAAEAES